MIDVLSEEMISLADAAIMLPARRAGKRVHVSCVYRWTTHGCRGVVLESVQVGATRCTSREAVARFVAALTAQAQGRQPAAAPLSAERRKRIREAEARLRAAGIK